MKVCIVHAVPVIHDTYTDRSHDKGGGGQGELKPPHILSSCYYVYKQLPQKDILNVLS